MKINKKIIVAILFFIIAGGVIGLLITKQKPVEKTPLSNVSSNVFFPWYHNNDMYYFTGSSFAKYDLTNNKTTRLSNFMYINSELSSVSWTEKSVLFNVPEVKDDMFSQAVNQFRPHGDDDITSAPISLSSADNHWWRYDLTTNELQLLFFSGADECTTIQENEGYIVCSRPYRGSQLETEIKTYNIATGELNTAFINKSPVYDIDIRNGKLYYISSDLQGVESIHTRSLNAPEKENTVYTSKETIVSFVVTQNDDKLLVQEVKKTKNSSDIHSDHDHSNTSTEPISQDLLLLSAKDGKKIANTSIESPMGELGANKNTLYFSSANGVVIESVNDTLEKSDSINEPPSGLITVFKNAQYVYAISNEGTFYTTYQGGTPESDSTFTAMGDDAGSFYIDNTDDQDQTPVYLYDATKGFIANSETVSQFLISKGFDPNVFNLGWVIDSTANEIPLDQPVKILTTPDQPELHSHH